MSAGSITIATWNTEWRKVGSADGQLICERLFEHAPDIVCVTEGYADLLGTAGHCITSQADYGYPLTAGRRKVVLWSRSPWQEVDEIGHPDMPSGRFVAGRTETTVGAVRVVGVCVPWKNAHVLTGRRDRQPWEDHLTYLECLGTLAQEWAGPTIVLGDLNQRVPTRYVPEHVHAALHGALPGRWRIATAGPIAPFDQLSIDHIVHSAEFHSEEVTGISNFAEDGRRVSDHFGVAVKFVRADG